MPDGAPNELHGREAEMHKALHDLLQQHHKVAPSLYQHLLGTSNSVHAHSHTMIASMPPVSALISVKQQLPLF